MMDINVAAGNVMRGTVERILETGEIIVLTAAAPGRVLCDFLQTGHGPAVLLSEGDVVLLMPPATTAEKGVVLGRIGPYQAPDLEHVTIEAGAMLTLKCGTGSITLRNDGKVLTRAQDIAAIADRSHRIRGGSVEIN